MSNVNQRNIVSREEWLAARKAHLDKEKEFTRQRDRLSRERRELPWVKLDTDYVFDGPSGKRSLSDLFEGRSQLIVYHFMFDPSWDEGCKSCSFWADNYNSIIVHLNQRDVSFAVVSKANLSTLEAYKQRMGWGFTWVSSFENEFNRDFHVSFTEQELAGEVYYNYKNGTFPVTEAPGLSVFFKDDTGVYHTYSCYSRGLDMLNGAYHHLDLVPKGRDEDELAYSMAWLRRHDEYGV